MDNSNKELAVFERTFRPHWPMCAWPFAILNIKFSKELWWVRQYNGNKHFSVTGIEIVEDKDDPTLRVYQFFFFGLVISLGFP